MKIMITGCNGQVGSCLVKQLKGKAELLAVDYEELDITRKKDVIDSVTQFNPDFIINAAAHTAVDKAEKEIESSYAINRDGPKYLAEAAQQCGAVMLHISTDYVFDGEGELAYKESDLTEPKGVYGKSKLAGEKAVAEACDRYLILRTAWVFGENGNNFVKTMLRLAETHSELSVVGDQFGGPTYAGDIAAALIRMAEVIDSGEQVEWGVYHFSGMPYASWFEFAQEIFVIAQTKGVIENQPALLSITTSAYPTPAKRPANSRMDCRKIAQQFDVQSSDWKRALQNISDYK